MKWWAEIKGNRGEYVFKLRDLVIVTPLCRVRWVVLLMGSIYRITSGGLIGAWLGLEVNLFCFICLMGRGRSSGVAACVKYFVIQCFGSSLFLFGMLWPGIKVGVVDLGREVFVLRGLFVKCGLFPFYSWVPSVVNSSDWLIRCMLLRWQKLAPYVLVGGLVGGVVLSVVVAAIRIVGGIGGLNQHSIRRILAYSSFVHSSWMLVGLSCSLSLFIFYFMVYSLLVSVFVVLLRKGGKVRLKTAGASISGVLGVVRLRGLPPFAGFIAKLVVFIGVNRVIVYFCIFGSLLALKYYLSVLARIAFGLLEGGPDYGGKRFIALVFVNVVAFV